MDLSLHRFQQLQKEIESSKFMTDIYRDNRQLFEYISSNVGLNITNIVKLDYIFDSLLIENSYGMKLPPWTKTVFPGRIKHETRRM